MRLKRLMAILLCLCMALTLLPTAALAADEGQTIYVGDAVLTTTAENPTVYARTVGGAVTTGGASATDYNIKWDGETLTLNNADISQGSHENAAIYFCDDSSLVLTGTNTVTGPAVTDGNSYGIYAAGSEEDITLTISGEGSLTATGGSAMSGEYLGSYGIQGDRIIINSGRVTAVGGKSDGYSYGVQAFCQVTINGGTVSAQGNAQTSISWGIFAMVDGVTISGGEVTAEGGDGAIDCNTDPVIIDPAEGQQIAVTRGDNASDAAAGSGLTFTSRATVYGTSYKYFHSVAEEAEGPGPDPDPDPDTPDPNIYVGGVGLYGDQDTAAYALTEGGAVTEITEENFNPDSDDWNIMWDGETLTLSGATIQGAHGFSYNTASASAAIYRTGGLEIALLDENKVSNPGGETNNYGIYVYGDITISGNGSLAASGGKGSTGSYGIYTDWGGVTVSGGGKVTAAGGEAKYYSYGIYAFNGDVTVSGGTVNATGGQAELSHGIHATDDINISGGRVTATGGTASAGDDAYSVGMYARLDITISGGTVNATGESASAGAGAYSEGISAYDVTISGGTVNATGGTATGIYAESCGIYAYDLTVSDGEVTATGGTASAGDDAYSVGMYARIDITISGGTVNATGGTATGIYAESCGIYFKEKATISGGEVTAEGATQAVRSFEGSVIIDPAEGQQITVTAGASKDSAAAISGSPFTSEAEINENTTIGEDSTALVFEANYFHSIAGEAGDPGPDDSDLYVGGVGLTGDKDTPAYALTDGNGNVTIEGASAADYNIMWDGETLTLKGATITQGSHDGAAIYCGEDAGIHLVLVGESTVTGPSGDDASRGIYTGGELTISGSGILNVSGGILNVSGGDIAASSNGLFVNGNLTISGGTVNATGGEVSGEYAYSCGIDADNVIVSGGTVNADGGQASVTAADGGSAGSYGIYVYGSIDISDGIVNADGGSATGSYAGSYGIYVTNDLTISGGAVTADGGEVTFTGSDGYAESYGIYVYGRSNLPGSITISGGTVNATGGTATGGSEESYGLSLPGTFTISGGTVTIAGETASFDQSKSILPNLSVLIAPQPKTQIRVQSGPNQEYAAEIKGSPFQEETEITGLASAAGVAYFKSAAEPARYSVTLHPNGGTIAGGKDVTSYLCGTGASLPGAGDVTRSGYRFAGWYADETLTDGPYTQISAADAGDMAFYARWVRRSSGGGGSSSSSRPAGPSTGHSDGWTDIREEIGSAEDGDTVTIDMNGETEVPAEIFEEIAGKDITVELDMGGGVLWTFNGLDIPEDTRLHDLDLGVDLGNSGIPATVINAITGEIDTVQLSLAHNGEFGFTLTLSAPLGRDNAGYWANLYWFNEETEELEFQQAVRISDNGTAEFDLDHASDYTIVIDDRSHEPAELPFLDVPDGAWYCDAAEYVYRHGLMAGTSDAAFSPDMTTSRAMIVTILWRMAGSPQVNYAMDFSDVPDGAWYSEAVRWAVSEGIAGGYGGGLFGPDDPVIREQLAAMLYRYAQHEGYDVSIGEDTNILSYADAFEVSEYAVSALQWACGAGIISGTGDGSTLTPQGEATRAQAATVLMRFCEQYQ